MEPLPAATAILATKIQFPNPSSDGSVLMRPADMVELGNLLAGLTNYIHRQWTRCGGAR